MYGMADSISNMEHAQRLSGSYAMFWEGVLGIRRGPLPSVDAFVCSKYECAFYSRVGSAVDLANKRLKDMENLACVCRVHANVTLHGGLNSQIKVEDHVVLQRV
jgi:hypothetical protein